MPSIRVRRASDGAQYITPIVATKPSIYAVRVRNNGGALIGYGMLSTVYPGHFTLRSVINGTSYYLVNPEAFIGTINVQVPGLGDTNNLGVAIQNTRKDTTHATGVQTGNIYTFTPQITGSHIKIGINVVLKTHAQLRYIDCGDNEA